MLNNKSLLYIFLLTGFGFISFIPELIKVDSRIITIPFRAINLLIILHIYIKETNINKNLGWFLFLIFWMFYSAKAIRAFLLQPNHLIYSPLEFFLFAFGICFIPAYSFYITIESTEIQKIKMMLYVSLTILSCISLISSLGGFTVYKSLTFTDARASGNSYFNPISLGHVSASLSALSYFLFLKDNIRKKRIIYFATFVLGIVLMFLTGSRGPIVSLIVCLAVLSVTTGKSKFSLKNIVFILSLIFIVPYAIEYSASLGSSLVRRVDSLGGTQQVYYDVRTTLFFKSVELFLSNPFFGIDTLDIPGFGYPHNIFVEAFVILGVFGGSLLLLIFIIGFKKMYHLLTEDHAASWIGILFLQYSVGSLFSGNLYSNPEFWCLYMGLIAIPNKREKE